MNNLRGYVKLTGLTAANGRAVVLLLEEKMGYLDVLRCIEYMIDVTPPIAPILP